MMVEGLVAQGGAWTRGTDAEVRATLERELARLAEVDPFSALGLPQEADDGAIRAAFLTATKMLHPNRFARRDKATLRLANEVYLKVKEAYQTLQSDEKRTQLRARLGKGTQPESAVEGSPPARPATSRRRPAPRRRPRLPRRQTTASPDEIRKKVMEKEEATEARFDEAKQLVAAGDPAAARDVFRELAVEHTTDRRFRVWMHYAMGKTRENAGEHDRAGKEYRRALDLDPDFHLAKKALSELPDDTAPHKKGLFAKLFKK